MQTNRPIRQLQVQIHATKKTNLTQGVTRRTALFRMVRGGHSEEMSLEFCSESLKGPGDGS